MAGEQKHKDAGMSRRGFLKWLGAFGTGAAASYSVQQLPPVKSFLSGSRYKQATLNRLFLPRGSVKFHHGGSHYMIDGIHSDNHLTGKAVVEALSSVIEVSPSRDDSIFELDEGSQWILVGAPSSSRIASTILGYDPDTLARPESWGPRLKYVYEYDDALLPLKRYTAGGRLQEQSRTAVIRAIDSGNLWQPRSSADGWIERDYLLVTRLPAERQGGSRTVVGGTHGIGTRGVDLLLSEAPFSVNQIRTLDESASAGFQILVAIEASTQGKQTQPVDLTVLDVVRL